MNLKKYLSMGHVVEDLNLHGRYLPSKPGMIPRFDHRKLGAARTHRSKQGTRHIAFSTKTGGIQPQEEAMNETHANTQSSGAHRKIAVSTPTKIEISGTPRSRRGVFKRVHGGTPKFQRVEAGDYQQDLFEKTIPIELGPDHGQSFELKIQKKELPQAVGHELEPPPPTQWKRIKGALSGWLRRG